MFRQTTNRYLKFHVVDFHPYPKLNNRLTTYESNRNNYRSNQGAPLLPILPLFHWFHFLFF